MCLTGSDVLRSRFASESARLIRVSELYFYLYPNELFDFAAVVRQGWVVRLLRLPDMLGHQLSGH